MSTLFTPAPTCALPPVADPAGPVQKGALAGLALFGAALVAYVGIAHGAKPAVLLALGIGLGIALFHSRFGFTSAWRQLVAVGNGTGLRAHAVLLGATATLFALVIGTGFGLFGTTPAPTAGPLGIGLVLGAFLFGIGMQLGGACASGTLFAVGGGQSTIVFTLFGFIAGSVIYTAAYPAVADLPALPAFVLADHVGWFGSWAVTIAVLGLIVLASRWVQARRNPPPVDVPASARGAARILRGSWPLWVGALVLAVLGAGVLVVSGGAWGVTSAFALWGAKALQVFGLHPETWTFWQQPSQAKMLAGPILADKNSLTDLGIMIGAAVAATAGGVWVLRGSVAWQAALISVGGGILLGIGARLAGGCNIGAYLAGIASGSLSGWIWGLAALGGTWVGLLARRALGMGVPAPTDSVC
jgi:uncharacterized membrane protein YedE/YeeE